MSKCIMPGVLFCRLWCSEHPHHMCVNHRIRFGQVMVDGQQNMLLSDTLSARLYCNPYLVTNQTLPHLIAKIAAHTDVNEVCNQLQALRLFLTEYPMPFWIRDMPYSVLLHN